jgi:hypothetical protein
MGFKTVLLNPCIRSDQAIVVGIQYITFQIGWDIWEV